MSSNPKLLAWSIMLFLSAVWGSSYILMDQALKVFSPVEVGGLRVVIAALCLLPFALGQFKKVRPYEWKYIVLIGILGNAIPAILFPLALTKITTATSGILNSLTPLFTLIAGATIFGLRFPREKTWGVLIGLIGAVVLVLAKTKKPGAPAAESLSLMEHMAFASLVILATVLYGISTNIMKKYLNRTSPLLVSSFALGSVFLPYAFFLMFTDVPTLISAGGATWKALGFLFILAALGTALALVLFNRLVQLTDAVFSSSVTYLMPVVVLVWSAFIGEEVGWYQMLGMGIILAGVYLVNRKTPAVRKAGEVIS